MLKDKGIDNEKNSVDGEQFSTVTKITIHQ